MTSRGARLNAEASAAITADSTRDMSAEFPPTSRAIDVIVTACDPAWDHHVEVAEIRRHIEREAVPRDPVARVHADRGDLAAAAVQTPVKPAFRSAGIPNAASASMSAASSWPQIPVQVAAVPLEIDDRIADELPRPVERDVAAALDLEQLDAPRREQLGGREQMPLLRRAPKRHHRRMLDEQQHVLRDLPAMRARGDGPLAARAPRRTARGRGVRSRQFVRWHASQATRADLRLNHLPQRIQTPPPRSPRTASDARESRGRLLRR